MRGKFFALSLAALCFAPLAMPGMGQDQPTVYTRVATWQIARPHWQAYEKSQKEVQQPVLEKLLADGVILEYGFDTVTVHGPEGGTHSTWFSSSSIDGLERALSTILDAGQKLTPEQRRQQDTDFSGDHHQDFLVRSLHYRTRPATLTEGYDVTSMVRVKAGKGREFLEFWNKYNRPVYEQLFNEGTITSYGLDEDVIHTAAPGARVAWYVVPNAAALDKVETALAKANAELSRDESEEIGRAYSELVDRDTHRDVMSRVIRYSVKKAAGSTDQ